MPTQKKNLAEGIKKSKNLGGNDVTRQKHYMTLVPLDLRKQEFYILDSGLPFFCLISPYVHL